MSRWRCANCQYIMDSRWSKYPHCGYCGEEWPDDSDEWIEMGVDETEELYDKQLENLKKHGDPMYKEKK